MVSVVTTTTSVVTSTSIVTTTSVVTATATCLTSLDSLVVLGPLCRLSWYSTAVLLHGIGVLATQRTPYW